MWYACVFMLALTLCEGAEENEKQTRMVQIAQGPVRGHLDSEGGLFGFYGIPYATPPTGNDKFKAPLPGPVWNSTLDAVDKSVSCLQPNPFGRNLSMQEDCLNVNVFVPDTDKTNLSVVVIVHAGRRIGNGNMITPKNLVRSQKVVAVTFNFRLGALGFLCLGTSDIPGNAALKDQVAALRWVNTNIASFGGNPNDVTIYGYNTGAAAVELLILSKSTKGLFHRAILDSGSSLAASSVQINPTEIAQESTFNLGCSNYDLYGIEKCYKLSPTRNIINRLEFNDVKGEYREISACVERDTGDELIVEDSPVNILKRGDYNKVPILYGFNDMEGLAYASLTFYEIVSDMKDDFSSFLPQDLHFSNETEKKNIAKRVKEFYFGNETIGEANLAQYVNFYSDTKTIYPILRSVKLHTEAGNDMVYLYQYSFPREVYLYLILRIFGEPIIVRGASRLAQTNAVLDTIYNLDTRNPNNETDEQIEKYNKMRSIVRQLWLNFITTGKPVPTESELPSWPPTGVKGTPYMELTLPPQLMHDELLAPRMQLWDELYARYYRSPIPPPAPPTTEAPTTEVPSEKTAEPARKVVSNKDAENNSG